MKKYGLISVLLLLAAAFAMLVPSNAIAAPTMRGNDEINVFNGRWFATRFDHGREIAERLKIECNKNTEICRVEIIADWSNTCTGIHGEDTGALLKGKGPVIVEWPKITINVDAYCLTKPPTFSNFSPDIWFEYNEIDDTLSGDLVGLTWHRGR